MGLTKKDLNLKKNKTIKDQLEKCKSKDSNQKKPSLLDKLFQKKKHGFIQLDKAKLDLMMINTTRKPETRNSTTRPGEEANKS